MSNSITIKKKGEIGPDVKTDAAKTVELVGKNCEIDNFGGIINGSIHEKQNVFEWIADKVTGKQDKVQTQQRVEENER